MISDGYEILCLSDLEIVLGLNISSEETLCGCNPDSRDHPLTEEDGGDYPDFVEISW